jgi:(2Fe-2S) ferredoxin
MSKPDFPSSSVFLCRGSKCGKHKDIRKALKAVCKELPETELFYIECTDRCSFAPVLSIQPQNLWLHETSVADIPKILDILKP